MFEAKNIMHKNMKYLQVSREKGSRTVKFLDEKEQEDEKIHYWT
jgi:hypothetical protein